MARLARLERAFEAVTALEAERRSEYLRELEARDPELANELSELLDAHDQPDERLIPRSGRRGMIWDEIEEDCAVLPAGTEVGDFRLLAKLGEGGMATVYRAVRKTDEFHQEVAVKVLRSTLESEAGRSRFARERRIVAAFDHPNIARLIDGGMTPGGRPYFALELVDGQPIDRYADEERLTVEERVKLVIEVGRALHYAHQNLVIHRDLKPSNVYVDRSGRVRLLDFGIAKELGSEDSFTLATLAGGGSPMTPVYASPEQIFGEALTTASDQYQLGLLLFELLTGRRHHLLDGDDPASILRRIEESPTTRPSRVLENDAGAEVAHSRRATSRELVHQVRGDLDWIVLKALARDPDRRYPTVSALVEDLERYLLNEPLTARPPSVVYRVRKWVGRNRAQSVLGVLLLLVILGSLWAARDQRLRAARVSQFSQRVERETEQIERILRDASLQPLHDTSRERRIVAERMARIEAEAERGGPALRPAADYGVGRGQLALGNHERAAALLEAAWEGGFRGEGIRWALGIVYGELYRKELAEARAIRDAGLRRERVEIAERKYRDPALAQLRSIAPEIEERAEQPAALIAFHEGRLGEALEIIDRVRSNFPWTRWAVAVEAEILTERAHQLYLTGELEQAGLDLERAGQALASGLEIGRSDADLYLKECQRFDVLMQVTVWPDRTSLQPLIANAEEVCGRAALIRPDWVEPVLSLASVYLAAWDSGRFWQGEGRTITVPMRAAVERALMVGPERTEVHHRLGISEYFEGFTRVLAGEGPGEHFDRATTAFEHAITLDPNYPFNYNGLALVASTLSGWQMRHGIDPTQIILRGRAQAVRAVELVPGWHNARTNLARNYIREGHWSSLAGSDPAPAYQRALEAVRAVLEVNPTFAGGLRLVGQAVYGLGAERVDSGLDPSDLAGEALENYRLALVERPFDGVSWIGVAGARLLAMWAQPEQPLAPHDLAQAREAVGLADQAFEVSVHVETIRLEIELLELKRAPRTEVKALADRIERALTETAALDLNAALVECSLAAGYRVVAAAALEVGSDPSPALRRGLEHAELSLAINPLMWSTAIERVALRLLAAAHQVPERASLLERLRADAREVLHRRPQSGALIDPLLEAAGALEQGTLDPSGLGERLRRYSGPFPFRR